MITEPITLLARMFVREKKKLNSGIDPAQDTIDDRVMKLVQRLKLSEDFAGDMDVRVLVKDYLQNEELRVSINKGLSSLK
jgi:hypothetical protein